MERDGFQLPDGHRRPPLVRADATRALSPDAAPLPLGGEGRREGSPRLARGLARDDDLPLPAAPLVRSLRRAGLRIGSVPLRGMPVERLRYLPLRQRLLRVSPARLLVPQVRGRLVLEEDAGARAAGRGRRLRPRVARVLAAHSVRRHLAVRPSVRVRRGRGDELGVLFTRRGNDRIRLFRAHSQADGRRRLLSACYPSAQRGELRNLSCAHLLPLRRHAPPEGTCLDAAGDLRLRRARISRLLGLQLDRPQDPCRRQAGLRIGVLRLRSAQSIDQRLGGGASEGRDLASPDDERSRELV